MVYLYRSTFVLQNPIGEEVNGIQRKGLERLDVFFLIVTLNINYALISSFLAGENFEPVPPSQRMAVEIRNMVKVYDNSTKALDSLSVSFYENQITGLIVFIFQLISRMFRIFGS